MSRNHLLLLIGLIILLVVIITGLIYNTWRTHPATSQRAGQSQYHDASLDLDTAPPRQYIGPVTTPQEYYERERAAAQNELDEPGAPRTSEILEQNRPAKP